MATQKGARGTKVYVKLGDGGGPETFSAPCGIVTNNFKFATELGETTLADCADPSLVMETIRFAVSRSWEMSGSGRLDTASLATWRAWWMSGAAKNVRLYVDVPGADGGGYFAGSAVIESFGLTGEQDKYAEIEVSIKSAGAVTWTGF